MERYQTKITITFTANADSKKEAIQKFIMSVVNHINLTSFGHMHIGVTEEEFKSAEKNAKKLPF